MTVSFEIVNTGNWVGDRVTVKSRKGKEVVLERGDVLRLSTAFGPVAIEVECEHGNDGWAGEIESHAVLKDVKRLSEADFR